jgi:excisionase family DNA binding protein
LDGALRYSPVRPDTSTEDSDMPAAAGAPPRHQLIDINALAELLGVQVRHVRRLVYERRIPYIKWGHLIRFDPTEIEHWIASHSNDAVR